MERACELDQLASGTSKKARRKLESIARRFYETMAAKA